VCVLNTLLGMSSGDVRRVLTQLRLIGVVFFTSALLAVSAVTHILTGRSVTASLGVAIASSLAIYLYGIWPYRRLRHIPGPEPEPFLGHLPQHLELGLPDFYRKVAKQYGKVAKVFMGRTPVVIVSDPELTKQVGMKLFKSFHDRPTGPKFREDFGLLVVRGEQWKRIRSAIVPTFNDAQLRSFQPAMNEAIERFLHNLERHYARAPDEPLAILPAWSAMTMEVIGSTCFGVRFPTQDDIKEKHPIIQATNDFFRLAQPSNHISLALVRTFPFLAPFVALLAANQVTQILQSLRTMDKVSLEITQKRRSDPKMAEYRDFVTLLLQAQDSDGKPLTDLEIRDQENTFLLAGYETTANSLSFLCFLLAQHPRVTDKLLKEIDELAPNGRVPAFEELAQFKYLECVVNESSRLYPVAMVVRQANEDTEIGGYFIPKGTEVHCPAQVLHYDPESYKDPEQFIPERFSEDGEEQQRRHKYAHIPFGLGPRMCIGIRFAQEELKLAIIRVLQRWRFSLHSRTRLPLEVEHGITLSPKDGIYLTLVPRAPTGPSK